MLIEEANVVEDDVAFDLGQLFGIRCVAQIFLVVENTENFVERDVGSLDGLIDAGETLDRAEQATNVAQERHESANGHLAFEDKHASESRSRDTGDHNR